MTTEELKKIEDLLSGLTNRIACLETQVAAGTGLTPYNGSAANGGAGEGSTGAGQAGGDPPSNSTSTGNQEAGGANQQAPGTTASVDSDYWSAAVQVGLALSQGGGLKGWQTAVAALLPAVAQGVDRSIADKPVLKAALVPAALSGAAYYIGRFATR
jgi:hypothetical protein